MAEQFEGALAQITDYELVALVELRRTDPALATLDAVGVRELLDDPSAQRAGLTGLLARGLAELEGTEVVIGGFAAALGSVMTMAGDVLRLDLGRDGLHEGRTVLASADEGAFLLDVGPVGVHTVQPLDADVHLVELVHDVLVEFGESEDVSPEAPLEVAITRFRASGERESAQLVVTGAETWTMPGTAATTADAVWDEAEQRLGLSDDEIRRRPRRGIAPDA